MGANHTADVAAAEASRYAALASLLKPSINLDFKNGVATVPLERITRGLEANQAYFDQPEWRESYLRYVHRNKRFRARWAKATGPWDGKVVVDVGCGPGNVAACLKQKAKLLVGVDVSLGALASAESFGYVPIQADAQDLPFKSGCADIVVVNATIHHCDDMERTLAEAARLVGPGGVLVTDHDPQLSAWNYKGIGFLLWKSRLVFYRILKKGFHRSANEQSVALESEIHHDAGDGVTPNLFETVLGPLGFKVRLYPHNHDLGDEIFDNKWGRASRKFRIAQMLSGINPNKPSAALSLMCVAQRLPA